MDIVGDMLALNLQWYHCSALQVVKVRPRFVQRFSRIKLSNKMAQNADRLLNRLFDYPRYLRSIRSSFDVFHVVDHSYSHLLHELPPERTTVVTCHDLRTFRCLLEPEHEPRSSAFRLMVRRTLEGLHRAQVVTCISQSTRTELLRYGLVAPEKSTVVHLGVAPVYSPQPEPYSDGEAAHLLGTARGLELLNVGSTTARKRLDVVLRVFAAARARYPDLRLIRVGGRLTHQQSELAQALRIRDAIVELPFLDSCTLAGLYRRAALVLCLSEAEGFGLSLLESMACGTPVVASDIAALREIGDGAADYAPVGDVDQCLGAVLRLLRERCLDPERSARRRQACIDRAANFSWRRNAARTAELYRDPQSVDRQ